MNTARISSTRSLQTICLTLLLGIAAHSLTPAHADPPADPSAKPKPNKAFAGTWRAKINMGGTDVPFVWVTDGQAFSTYIEGQPTPFITGTLEAANGHWKTKTAFAPLDEGPFHFVDADTISMTGKARQEVIWRRQRREGQCDADEGDTAVRPNDAGNHGESVVAIGDFGQRSCRAGHPGRFRGTSQASPRGGRPLEFCGGTLSRRLVGRLQWLSHAAHRRAIPVLQPHCGRKRA